MNDQSKKPESEDEEERWEIDPEKSTADEIVLRPARHPKRGHTRTLGDIAEKLGEAGAKGDEDDEGDGAAS